MSSQPRSNNAPLGGKIVLICFMIPFVAAGIFTFLIGTRILDLAGEESWIILIFSLIWNLFVFSFVFVVIQGFKNQRKTNASLLTSKSKLQKYEEYDSQKEIGTRDNHYYNSNKTPVKGDSIDDFSENGENNHFRLIDLIIPNFFAIGFFIFTYLYFAQPVIQDYGGFSEAIRSSFPSFIIPGILLIIALKYLFLTIKRLSNMNKIN